MLQYRSTTKRQLHAPQLNVALAVVVPYGVLDNSEWRDGMAVMALSAQKVAARSTHRTTLLAIMPDSIDRKEEEERVLAKIGLKALFVPVPVPLDQVENEFARGPLSKVLGQFEQLKWYGAALTQYDRVVVLDGDTMWRAPIDELFADAGGIKLQGIYAHEMDTTYSAFPPVNSGFLVFTPDKRDFDALKDIVREGNLSGSGWEGSGTGWTYGTGSQGVLSFYYNMVQPGVKGYNPAKPTKGKDLPGMPFTKQPPTSRFRPLDRSVYNVVDTTLLEDALRANRTNASRVKVFHFTGGCAKPWTCHGTRDGGICEQMTEEWWSLRAELAEKWGGEARRCQPKEKYEALPLPESEAI